MTGGSLRACTATRKASSLGERILAIADLVAVDAQQAFEDALPEVVPTRDVSTLPTSSRPRSQPAFLRMSTPGVLGEVDARVGIPREHAEFGIGFSATRLAVSCATAPFSNSGASRSPCPRPG